MLNQIGESKVFAKLKAELLDGERLRQVVNPCSSNDPGLADYLIGWIQTRTTEERHQPHQTSMLLRFIQLCSTARLSVLLNAGRLSPDPLFYRGLVLLHYQLQDRERVKSEDDLEVTKLFLALRLEKSIDLKLHDLLDICINSGR